MTVGDNSFDFLKELHTQYRDVVFLDSAYQNLTVKNTLMRSIKNAVEHHMLDKTEYKKILETVKPLEGRSIQTLTPDEKESILTLFKSIIANREESESGYGSGVQVPDLPVSPKAGIPKEIQGIKDEQQKIRELVMKQLQNNQCHDLAQQRVPVEKNREGDYDLYIHPCADLELVKPEDLTLDADMPHLFKTDHYTAQRGQYIQIHLRSKPAATKSVVYAIKTQKDARQVISAVGTFVQKLASSQEKEKVLSHALLLFTTQYLANWILSPILNVHNGIISEHREQFPSQITSLTVLCEPIQKISESTYEVDRFKVTLGAVVHTGHKSLMKDGVFSEQLFREGQASGIQPVLEGRVQGSFICRATSQEMIDVSKVQARYSLRVL
jgi:hypothetical protein